MFLKKMALPPGVSRQPKDRSWKVMFGKSNKDSKALNIMFKHIDPMRFKEKFKLYEPLLLDDLHALSADYKFFFEGYQTRPRIFKNINLAFDTFKDYYRKVFEILVVDEDINRFMLEEDELKYLEQNLPDNNTTKVIITKLRRFYGN